MEREYNVGTWLTPSDEYIKDIKQTLVEKGVATELTPNEELSESIKNSITLKECLNVRNGQYFFFESTFTSIEGLINYGDTENITNATGMFQYCRSLQTIPLLNTSKVNNMYRMFYGCQSLINIPNIDVSNVNKMNSMFEDCYKLTSVSLFNTNKVTDMYNMFQNCKELRNVSGLNTSKAGSLNYLFYGCVKLESIPKLETSNATGIGGTFQNCYVLKTIELTDLSKVTYTDSAFKNCKELENLTLYNLITNLQIGSGTSWGHLLTLDSLINTCKECIKQTQKKTLTVGTANLEKLANVYVRFVDRNQTTIPTNTKGEVEVCEADNNDAMTITEYMTLKKWTLA